MFHRSRLLSSLAFALATCAVFAPSTASAQHYIDLPGTQPGGLSDGAPLDSASSCGITCHYSRDPATPSAMPYDGWLGSMMGNSMRDPLFLAALSVAEQDAPGVGDWCLRCHTPPGFVGGRTRSSMTASRGTDLMVGDRDGINCDSCHRMVETTNLGNAQYQMSPTETRFGPYPVIESIRHTGAVSAWLADSRMCGTCHEISNPTQNLLRADGTDTGLHFPLDTTYSEWAESAFAVAGSADARTCQDCHMPRVGMPGRVSTNMTAMLRDNPRRHSLAGANAWGLRVLAAMRTDVASGEFYDPDAVVFYEQGALRAEATLRTAVSLEVRQSPMMAMPGERVQVVARVTNLSGHRVPSGYGDGRRMWLDVTLIDADRHETVVSGGYNATEAHLDESDPQLKVYETVQGRAGMGREDHIALHNTILHDTRLPPRGYHPSAGHEPVGVDYTGGEGGALRHWDDATYSFAIPAGASGPLTVRVRARYQSTTREYVETLAAANHTDARGRELLARYEASGRAAPFDMVVANATIQVNAPPRDSGPADVPTDRNTTDATTQTQTDAGADVVARDASGMDVPVTQPPAPAPDCGCRTGAPTEGPRRGPIGALVAACALVVGSRSRRVRRAAR